MMIKKEILQRIVDDMPEVLEVDEVFDRILLSAKIELALEESEQGLGEDFENFKRVF